MKICLYSLLVVLLGLSAGVYAEGEAMPEEELISGQELLDGCVEGAAPGAPNQYCMKYVFGLVQILDTFQKADSGPQIFCIDPNQVSLQEVTETTTNWLKQSPNRLEEDAQQLVTEALHANYPCSLEKI